MYDRGRGTRGNDERGNERETRQPDARYHSPGEAEQRSGNATSAAPGQRATVRRKRRTHARTHAALGRANGTRDARRRPKGKRSAERRRRRRSERIAEPRALHLSGVQCERRTVGETGERDGRARRATASRATGAPQYLLGGRALRNAVPCDPPASSVDRPPSTVHRLEQASAARNERDS